MKQFKSIIKIISVLMIVLVAISLSSVILFINLSPQFGGSATSVQKAQYQNSTNYLDGKFANQGEVQLDMSLSDIGTSLIGYFRPVPHTSPTEKIPVETIDSLNLEQYSGDTRLIWFGHSTFLVQINARNILIDPMFGQVAAPHPLLGSSRFSEELPITIERLPQIDAVIISHDHYDHLDYSSIIKLKDKVKMFYTPLGVGAHLLKWGINKERIVELDWWQNASFEDLVLRCTPAQHFSGRGIMDRASTLWSSWIIESTTTNLFFSGDSGYGPHFKEIGDLYGPFNLALLECGQYSKMWPDVHMFPEQTAQAGLDIKAAYIMPIHWGAFKLAMHSWKDPIERLQAKASELQVKLVTPKIGEPIVVSRTSIDMNQKWWQNY